MTESDLFINSLEKVLDTFLIMDILTGNYKANWHAQSKNNKLWRKAEQRNVKIGLENVYTQSNIRTLLYFNYHASGIFGLLDSLSVLNVP